mmetsp:Transcript_37979/g.118502  ORF Transcript_37979/g.118502 Transcript_37979/m.118502 type:complete len:406 (-) Transcript_37979:95-1312(-)
MRGRGLLSRSLQGWQSQLGTHLSDGGVAVAHGTDVPHDLLRRELHLHQLQVHRHLAHRAGHQREPLGLVAREVKVPEDVGIHRGHQHVGEVQLVLELVLARHLVDLVQLRLHLRLLEVGAHHVEHPGALAAGEAGVEGSLAHKLCDGDLRRQLLVVLQRMLPALHQHPGRGRHVATQGPPQHGHLRAVGHHDLQRPARCQILLGAGLLALHLDHEERLVRCLGVDLARLLLLRPLAREREPEVRGARRYSVRAPHGVLRPLQHQVPPSGDLAMHRAEGSLADGRVGLDVGCMSGLRLLEHLLEHRGHTQERYGCFFARLGVRLQRRGHAVDLEVRELPLGLLAEACQEGVHGGTHGAVQLDEAFQGVDLQLLLPPRRPSGGRDGLACAVVPDEMARQLKLRHVQV